MEMKVNFHLLWNFSSFFAIVPLMKNYIYSTVSTAIFGGLLLAGCSDVRPISYEQPTLTYENLQAQPVAVANITVFDKYQPPMTPSHVDHLMANSPKEALKKYLDKKVRAADGDGEFKFTILDASVVIKDVSNKDTVVGWFDVNPSKEYKASLVVEADYRPDMYVQKTFTIKAERTAYISDYSNMIDREKTQFELVEALMEGFDHRMNEVLLKLPQ